jgi:predicted component of type VI protein secretion system
MHYLKVMGRDLPPQAVERWSWLFTRWASQYVRVAGDPLDPASSARPFRACYVDVKETPQGKENFQMVAFIRPEYRRVHELSIEIRLAADFSNPPPPLN